MAPTYKDGHLGLKFLNNMGSFFYVFIRVNESEMRIVIKRLWFVIGG